ncbi:hypothetical protein ACIQI7_34910 [Kitasatospora sp. NPDC092039]
MPLFVPFLLSAPVSVWPVSLPPVMPVMPVPAVPVMPSKSKALSC